MLTVDFSYLNDVTDGDQELIMRLCGHFENTLKRCTTTLKSTTEKADWQNTCHELKGAALSIGATALAQICLAEEEHASLAMISVEAMEEAGFSALEALHQHFQLYSAEIIT